MTPPPPWLLHAGAERGVRTWARGRSNPRITEYHALTNIAGYDDKAAWCSSFVHWCLDRCGIEGTGSALARSWLDWGMALDAPREGCIAVLTREDPAGWRGHVGFWLEDEGDQVVLLGGNQQDAVCEHRYPRSSVLGWRWPAANDDTLFMTPRTRVRRLRRGDAAAMQAIYGDRDAMRYVGDGEPLTLAVCERWIDVTFGNLEHRGYGMCAVMDRERPDEMIGCCGLVHPGGQADSEVKYAFRRDHWGRGIAGEVIPALVRWGLEILARPLIMATVAPEHRVSRRVLERAGLRHVRDRGNDDGSTTAIYEVERTAVRIRPARPDEAAALSRLAFDAKASSGYASVDLERWRSDLAIAPDCIAAGTAWVAEDALDGALAGVLVCGETPPRWTLEHLWVAPDRMRRGIGRALLSHAVNRAHAAGACELYIDADPYAEPFYAGCGAARVGELPAPTENQPQRTRPKLLLPITTGA